MIYKNPNSMTIQENTNMNENVIEDVARHYVNTQDLKAQWKEVADSFVKHKWIYRYINDKQKENLEKHYAKICDEKTNYSTYKRSFQALCNFMGIPADRVIIEWIVFDKDKKDKEQWKMSIRYSKGLAKVKIPDGVRLIHVSPVENIDALVPTFRSKTKGKFLYPDRRVFFTVTKEISNFKMGTQNQKRFRYTPKEDIKYAYIDPTYADFKDGAVYISTDNPIPVETLEKKLFGIFNMKKKKKPEEVAKEEDNKK